MLNKLLRLLEARCVTVLNDMHSLIKEVCSRGNVGLHHLISLTLEIYVRARSGDGNVKFLGRKRVRRAR